MAKMTLERAVGMLESMYIAHLVRIDHDRDAARKYGRMKTPLSKAAVATLREAVKVREETAAALGVAVDALRKKVAE